MRRGFLTLAVALLILCACNVVTQQPTPTLAAPTVEFQFPLNNVAVAAGTDLQIGILARDSVGVARVELRVDGSLHQQASPVEAAAVPVFTVEMNWLAEGIGMHALEATAYRLDGTASTPTLINVSVTPAS